MSYLLEALKKAEIERQAQTQSPDSIVAPVATTANLPVWLIVVVVGFLAVTVFKLFSPQSSNNVEPVQAQVQTTPVHEPVVEAVTPAQTLPKQVEETEVAEPQPAPQQPAKTYELAELPKEVLGLIPTISLQSHIYSSAQEYRSVVINGQTFNEGMFINAQVVLQEITHTGIVINVAGRKISLAKGLSWVSPKHVK
ncbi:hypothetical protein A9Q73_11675 [Bermanella sp. 47_1433_sub80_T6]|nr:hypothetical protein A9Q73_11675 [Bermanella sp. 47_1433_sub80_T6]